MRNSLHLKLLAQNLKNGDWLALKDMSVLKIKNIEKIANTKSLFDITVKKHHNFYISTNTILVHNQDESSTLASALHSVWSLIWPIAAKETVKAIVVEGTQELTGQDISQQVQALENMYGAYQHSNNTSSQGVHLTNNGTRSSEDPYGFKTNVSIQVNTQQSQNNSYTNAIKNWCYSLIGDERESKYIDPTIYYNESDFYRKRGYLDTSGYETYRNNYEQYCKIEKNKKNEQEFFKNGYAQLINNEWVENEDNALIIRESDYLKKYYPIKDIRKDPKKNLAPHQSQTIKKPFECSEAALNNLKDITKKRQMDFESQQKIEELYRQKMQGMRPEEKFNFQQKYHCKIDGTAINGYGSDETCKGYVPVKIPTIEEFLAKNPDIKLEDIALEKNDGQQKTIEVLLKDLEPNTDTNSTPLKPAQPFLISDIPETKRQNNFNNLNNEQINSILYNLYNPKSDLNPINPSAFNTKFSPKTKPWLNEFNFKLDFNNFNKNKKSNNTSPHKNNEFSNPLDHTPTHNNPNKNPSDTSPEKSNNNSTSNNYENTSSVNEAMYNAQIMGRNAEAIAQTARDIEALCDRLILKETQMELHRTRWHKENPLRVEHQKDLNDVLAYNNIHLTEQQRKVIGERYDYEMLWADTSDKSYNFIKELSQYAYEDRNNKCLSCKQNKYSSVTDFSENFNGLNDILKLREKRQREYSNELKPATGFTLKQVQKPFELAQWKDTVEKEYKNNGHYLDEANRKKLDTLLNANNIDVSPNRRQRLEQQCAINLKENSGYFDDWVLDVNSDIATPNNDNIRNMGDVWKSRRERAPNPDLSKKIISVSENDKNKIMLCDMIQDGTINSSDHKGFYEYLDSQDTIQFKQPTNFLNNAFLRIQGIGPKIAHRVAANTLIRIAQSQPVINGINTTLNALDTTLINYITPLQTLPSNCVVDAHQITSGWNGSPVTNNPRPTLSKTIFDCSQGIAQGLLDGIIDGTRDGLTSTYNLFRHPIDSAISLSNTIQTLQGYIPIPVTPQWLCTSPNQYAEQLQHQKLVAENWDNAKKQLGTWFNETPTPEKFHQITKGVTHIITSIAVGNRSLSAVGNTGRFLGSEALSLYRKAEKIKTVPASIPNGTPGIHFNNSSEVEKFLGSSGKIIPKTPLSPKILEFAKGCGVSAEQASKALIILEEEGGCIKRFHEAVEKLSDIEGVKNILI